MEGSSGKKQFLASTLQKEFAIKEIAVRNTFRISSNELVIVHVLPTEKDTKERDPRKRGNQAKESNRVQGSCTVHHSEVEHMMKLSGNFLLLTASQDRDVYVYHFWIL